jgi:hypothetical protein
MAQLEVGQTGFDDEGILRAYLSTHGEGLKNVQLTLQRKMVHAKQEQTIAQATPGMESVAWKPSIRNFDVALVTYSNIGLSAFVDFLKFLGADAKMSFLGNYMTSDFLLCDGANMNYTFKLSGEKHFLGHEEDKTELKLG